MGLLGINGLTDLGALYVNTKSSSSILLTE